MKFPKFSCLKTDDFEKEMKIGLLTIVFGFSEATETRDLGYRRPRWKELLEIMKNQPSEEDLEEGLDARGKKGKARFYYVITQKFQKQKKWNEKIFKFENKKIKNILICLFFTFLNAFH